jgi:hypothetical protein
MDAFVGIGKLCATRQYDIWAAEKDDALDAQKGA